MLKRICVNKNYQTSLKEMLIWATIGENWRWPGLSMLKIITKVTLWLGKPTWTWQTPSNLKRQLFRKVWCKWICKIQQGKVLMNNIILKLKINNKQNKILELESAKNDLWQHVKTLQICSLRKTKINLWAAYQTTIKVQIDNPVPFC